ncbi:hypothetical protein FS749_010659 [Ceratobasidium sp. UAMH 11750]|nr:hypothetical protein FS749_010659 [Ceratobasidium sp. UAMH 11750]
MSLDTKYDARKDDSGSSKYCIEWVSRHGRILPTCSKKGSATKFQDEGETCDSEAEVDSLIRLEEETESLSDDPNGGTSNVGQLSKGRGLCNTYGGPIHSPKPRNVVNNTPLTHPTSYVRTIVSPVPRYPSFNHVEFEPRTPEPGDWSGPRFGDIHYMLPPLHLIFLLQIGSQWSFSHTAPESHCRNRLVGDIHFTPGEVKGYAYWVCCAMEGTKFGRGWVPWKTGNAHPLYPKLALQHFYTFDAPSWARKLEE